MSSSNKVKIPGRTSAASFQALLTTCTVGHWKEELTENGSEHVTWTVPRCRRSRFGDRTREQMQEAVVLHSSVALGHGAHQHREPPGPALPKGQRKWLTPNRPLPVEGQPTASVSLNSEPFQEVPGGEQAPAATQEVERAQAFTSDSAASSSF